MIGLFIRMCIGALLGLVVSWIMPFAWIVFPIVLGILGHFIGKELGGGMHFFAIGICVLIGLIIGGLISLFGGWLIEACDGRWIFAVMGIIAAILTRRMI